MKKTTDKYQQYLSEEVRKINGNKVHDMYTYAKRVNGLKRIVVMVETDNRVIYVKIWTNRSYGFNHVKCKLSDLWRKYLPVLDDCKIIFRHIQD